MKINNSSCSLGDFGDWSSSGCTLIKVVNNIAECECNHLTNFALLMDTSQNGKMLFIEFLLF